jgi:hypothetical protein
MSKGRLSYYPKEARRHRLVSPASLWPMLLKYFHDSGLPGHLRALKTFQKFARNFYWPKLRADLFEYVHCCDLCQRAKPARSPPVGLHSTSPVFGPMERLFIDLMCPLTRLKQGNVAILVLLAVSPPLSEKICPRSCVRDGEELFPFVWYARFLRDG